MGQSADQLREEIDQKREDAAAKIDAIEHRVEDTVQHTRDTVEDTVQHAKDSLDIRRHIEEKPLISLGVAMVGGFILGGITGGDKGEQRSPESSQGNGPYTSPSAQGSHGMMGSVRSAAKSSGLEDTLSNATAALMGTLTERLKATMDQSFPGFADKLQQTQGTSGGFSEKSQAAQSSGMSGGSAETSAYYPSSDAGQSPSTHG